MVLTTETKAQAWSQPSRAVTSRLYIWFISHTHTFRLHPTSVDVGCCLNIGYLELSVNIWFLKLLTSKCLVYIYTLYKKTYCIRLLFTGRLTPVAVILAALMIIIVEWTNPEAREIWIGGIVGLVVSFHQAGDDPGLLIVQPRPHCLPGCLLFFPLQNHILLPLNLLICEDN